MLSSFQLFHLLLIPNTQLNVLAQRIVDKNKGNHNKTKKGLWMAIWLQLSIYNFGEIADWLNEPSRSGVWPKGTNHTIY